MSSIVCPFCEHENPAGTRFCADCGASVYLKVCPNPECGKISNVSAEVCESCGQSFPKKESTPTETPHAEALPVHETGAGGFSAKGSEKSRIPALPLIIVAIVAGGLPLFWLNRDKLPAPKTWQNAPAETTKSTGTAPVAPSPASPIVVPPVPTSTPVQTKPDASASSPTAQVPVAAPAGQPHAKAAPTAPVAKAPEPPRPCTDAMAAVGLCEKKSNSQ